MTQDRNLTSAVDSYLPQWHGRTDGRTDIHLMLSTFSHYLSLMLASYSEFLFSSQLKEDNCDLLTTVEIIPCFSLLDLVLFF